MFSFLIEKKQKEKSLENNIVSTTNFTYIICMHAYVSDDYCCASNAQLLSNAKLHYQLGYFLLI